MWFVGQFKNPAISKLHARARNVEIRKIIEKAQKTLQTTINEINASASKYTTEDFRKKLQPFLKLQSRLHAGFQIDSCYFIGCFDQRPSPIGVVNGFILINLETFL